MPFSREIQRAFKTYETERLHLNFIERFVVRFFVHAKPFNEHGGIVKAKELLKDENEDDVLRLIGCLVEPYQSFLQPCDQNLFAAVLREVGIRFEGNDFIFVGLHVLKRNDLLTHDTLQLLCRPEGDDYAGVIGIALWVLDKKGLLHSIDWGAFLGLNKENQLKLAMKVQDLSEDPNLDIVSFNMELSRIVAKEEKAVEEEKAAEEERAQGDFASPHSDAN